MKKKIEIIKNQILAHKNKVHKIFSEHYTFDDFYFPKSHVYLHELKQYASFMSLQKWSKVGRGEV